MTPGKSGPSAQAPIWEEPVRGFYTNPGQFVALSGLDLLRSVLEGGLGPPVRYLFGLGLTAVEPAATRDPDMARHPVQPERRIYHDSFFTDPAVAEDDYHRMRRRSTTSR